MEIDYSLVIKSKREIKNMNRHQMYMFISLSLILTGPFFPLPLLHVILIYLPQQGQTLLSRILATRAQNLLGEGDSSKFHTRGRYWNACMPVFIELFLVTVRARSLITRYR